MSFEIETSPQSSFSFKYRFCAQLHGLEYSFSNDILTHSSIVPLKFTVSSLVHDLNASAPMLCKDNGKTT